MVDLVLVLEETGSRALPEPIVEHAAVTVPILADSTAAAAGRVTVTAALDGSGLVPWADTAELIVLHRATGAAFDARADVELDRHDRRSTAPAASSRCTRHTGPRSTSAAALARLRPRRAAAPPRS